MKASLSFTLYLGLAFSLLSCTAEPPISQSDLNGNWEVVEAARNGKKTETVVGAYFHFDESGLLTTNLLNGDTLTGPYRIDGYTLTHSPEKMSAMDYEVKKSETGEALELSTRINDYNFLLLLQPKAEE